MLKDIEDPVFDLVIIGGGITGAGVARDAILRGLKVVLFEKGDFGSGTSSMTSKLLHGGLRYLKNYEFRLVRHAALERKVHVDIAPHLAEVMEFLVPLYTWNADTTFKLRLGLILYDLLAFPKRIGKHKNLGTTKLIEKLPLLENSELKGGALYHDVRTDDARLTLANILSAAAGGAKTINYAEVTSWSIGEETNLTQVKDMINNTSFTVKSRGIILCGGPWTELLEKRGKHFQPNAKVRLTRGTHIMLKKKLNQHPCLLVNEDNRPIFLIPRLDYDLAGTTDIDFNGSPEEVVPTKEDTEYILKACNRLFPTAKYTKDDVVAAFAGVRPLVFQSGVTEGKVSRDHSIFSHKIGHIITIVGGKLTTYRRMSKEAIDKMLKLWREKLSEYKCVTDKLPLWGGEVDDWNDFKTEQVLSIQEEFNLEGDVASMLVSWYGSEVEYLKEILHEFGTSKLLENRPWLEAQVIYSCRVELAQTPIDFLRRRTQIMLEEGNGLQILKRVCELMQRELNWNTEIVEKMEKETIDYVKSHIMVEW